MVMVIQMNWVQYWWKEFWRYMDTSVPQGYNEKKFTDTKYSNIEKIERITTKYSFIDKTVLEMVAIQKFLDGTEQEILGEIIPFMEEKVYEKPKRNG